MEDKENSNMKEINDISNKVFELAKKKMAGKKIENLTEKEQIIKKLQNLLSQVSFIDEIEAKRLVSETILDLDYSTNPDVKVLSLRMGQIYRNQD